MKREIVKIDDEKCTGCGECVPNCHEGALQIIDGKAVLVSELMCDGLGACLGHCPEGALEIELREADAYDEVKVMAEMLPKGKNVVIAHLKHLKEHGEFAFLKQGVGYLTQNQDKALFDIKEVIDVVHHTPAGGTSQPKVVVQPVAAHYHGGGGCPGSQSRSFVRTAEPVVSSQEAPSALTQWPVQMHLINPMASFFQGANLLVAADCVAFSLGNFHSKFLQDKKLAIACPKLDSSKEIYLDKLITMIDNAKVNTITVMIMEVPCCGGLLQLVMKAVQSASRKVPVKAITVGIQGDILSEDWV
ncbi:MAG: 4Fe-4S binding protein [Bacteroidota bacterium]|nr:4Fe-4S binding protein [Bacteroidota bacterium]